MYAEPHPARPEELGPPGFEKYLAAREVNDGYAALWDGSFARVVVSSF
jgi:hypothetical protein